ncbi:MAG: polyketide cyclase [Bacteroidota bacterium]
MHLALLFLLLLSSFNLCAQESEPSNKHFWHRVATTASPEDIWSIWIDVSNWKQWDIGLQDAFIDDSFQLGAKGKIISLEDRKAKFKIIEYIEGESYTYRVGLPFGSLSVRRFLEIMDGQTFFTHEVWFTGLTRGLFAKSLGKEFREMLPVVMENIKNIAEQ